MEGEDIVSGGAASSSFGAFGISVFGGSGSHSRLD